MTGPSSFAVEFTQLGTKHASTSDKDGQSVKVIN